MDSSSSELAAPATRSPSAVVGGARGADAIIGVTGALIGVIAAAEGAYAWFRPNLIVDGTAATAFEIAGIAGGLVVALWVAAGILAVCPPGTLRGFIQAACAAGGVLLGLAAVGIEAMAFAETVGLVARTSLGVAFYTSVLALYFVVYSAARSTRSSIVRAVILWLPAAGLVVLAVAGLLSELGIVREWELARSLFAREAQRHLFYALGATGGAMLLGIPAGIAAARRTQAEAVIMGGLSIGQVFPALAFVGIMMPVLGALGARVPALGAIGVSGIGWAPVFIVLLVYALFPIARNTLVAIRQLDPAVLDAASGMGMGRWRMLLEIELPMAFPVVLAGIRVALVQSTAGAIIAAFVGGGGFGTIVFFGLEQTSMDLVLVGVLPIVALALVFDSVLRSVERVSRAEGVTAS